jgi:hypothetical protein
VPSFYRSQAFAFALLPLTALCWAGNHVVARAASGHVPPASMAVLRWLIVALAILPVAWPHLRADWPKLKAHPWLMVLFAVTGGGAAISHPMSGTDGLQGAGDGARLRGCVAQELAGTQAWSLVRCTMMRLRKAGARRNAS